MIEKKQYSDEFKREALRLQETSGKRVAEVERELGLSHGLLRQWKARFPDSLELNEVEQLKAELRRVKREMEVVQQERDILKKNGGHLLEGCAAMKYQAIEACKTEFPVSRLCAVLNIAENGYYAWLNQVPSAHKQENGQLQQSICTIWKQYRGVYGAPRIHAELQEQGINVGHNRVARLMRQAGIQGKTTRKRRPHTTQSDPTHPVAANVLDRQFTATHPNEVWLTDITYIDTSEGFLYLAAVLDLYSRQIVGMAMADHLRTDLVESALDMALTQRRPPRNLLHHSDRGSQYTSLDYQKRLSASYMTVSMSRVGNCWDNAPMESFWATLKRECADGVFASHSQARVELFGYIRTCLKIKQEGV